MRNLFAAAKLLLLDMASTFLFLVIFLLTRNLPLSVVLGMALGVAQIGWQFARKNPIDAMQWMSLFLVLGFGTSSLDHLHEKLRAAELKLSDEVLARLQAIDSEGDQ
jgi:intracellular septation protein A